MTMIQINITDELKEAFKQAFPNEPIDAFMEHLLKDAIERRQTKPRKNPEEVLEMFRKLAEKFPPMSQEEIRRLRLEGRP